MAQSWVMGHALSGDDLPVLDLEHEDAAARVQDDEVGISRHGPDWSVAPAEVIVSSSFSSRLAKRRSPGVPN